MSLILVAWSLLCLVFLSVSLLYYLYMKRAAVRPWQTKIDRNHKPFVTVLIPFFNEERVITFKLENLLKVEYPREKIQVVLINDASRDKSRDKVRNFAESHNELNIKILNLAHRRGKSEALNFALNKANGDVVVVSDADSFLSPDILIKTMPYLVDPSVGAVISRERLLDADKSWVSQTEKFYFDLVYECLRLGESKIHSTIVFHGGFAAYKRSFLSKFNFEADDSGTALDIVQKGGRTILIPEATSFTVEFVTWKGKFATKIRRATQLMGLWARSLKLLLKKELVLPKKIAIPEIILYFINPLVFLALLSMTAFLFLEYPVYFGLLSLILVPIFLPQKTRIMFIEVLQNNFILAIALFAFVSKKKHTIWNTEEEPRYSVTEELLEKQNLI